MKHIVLSVMTICLVSLMIVGGAFASFNDISGNSTVGGNTITAGTLDLVVNAENPLQSTLVDLDNMGPGEYREVDVQLTNEGSLSGDAWMMFSDLVCSTNAFVEPEAEAEAGIAVDDLCSMIVVSVNGVEQGTMADIENIAIPLATLQPAGDDGAGILVTMGFLLVEETGNEYQGDTCEFTLVFGLDQADQEVVSGTL